MSPLELAVQGWKDAGYNEAGSSLHDTSDLYLVTSFSQEKLNMRSQSTTSPLQGTEIVNCCTHAMFDQIN